jgi:hypothetical protein
MGRTVITITQLLNETEADLSAFRRTLRRGDQYVFDGLFASARRHIAAIGQAESLLPFECSAGDVAGTVQGDRRSPTGTG